MQNNVQNLNNGELYRAIHHFNWGAFYFDVIFGLGNGCFKKIFIPFISFYLVLFVGNLVLGFIGLELVVGLVEFIFFIAMKIYFGMNANQWAFDGRAWASISDFEETQHRWGVAATVMLCLSIIPFLIAIIVVLAFGAVFGLH